MCGIINAPCREIDELISQWIYSERDRAICHRRFIDGIGMESLASEFDLSVSQIKRIVANGKQAILSQRW